MFVYAYSWTSLLPITIYTLWQSNGSALHSLSYIPETYHCADRRESDVSLSLCNWYIPRTSTMMPKSWTYVPILSQSDRDSLDSLHMILRYLTKRYDDILSATEYISRRVSTIWSECVCTPTLGHHCWCSRNVLCYRVMEVLLSLWYREYRCDVV